jgi:beta-glucanase (GH16 family)
MRMSNVLPMALMLIVGWTSTAVQARAGSNAGESGATGSASGLVVRHHHRGERLSGAITPAIGGVVLNLSGAATATTSTSNFGTFAFTDLANGAYVVTPSAAGYTFSPASLTVAINDTNVTGANFTQTALTYAISGMLDPTAGGAGATVQLRGASTATTTSSGTGAYSFSGLANGSYTVTPSNTGYNFTPSSRAVTVNAADVTGVNFKSAAAPSTYAISGSISPVSLGAGSTITLTGAGSAVTTADGSGNFSFPSLGNGSYTVTPSSTKATFNPVNSDVTVNGGNVRGVSFAATATATAGTIFYDDFTGATLTTTGANAWYVMNRPGDSSNSELQCYFPANVTVANSDLSIVSNYQPGSTCGGSFSSSYTSGMVQWNTFNFTYGTVEFRAKMAGGQGTWPAIWLLGANCQSSNESSADNTGACNWPQAGSNEIDITEIKGGDLTTVNQNVVNTAGGWNVCAPTTTDVSQNWHVYQLVWTSSSLTWYIDGTQTCEVTSSSFIPSTPMFLIINTAIGGAGGGTPNSSAFPQGMLIDYVKITQPY